MTHFIHPPTPPAIPTDAVLTGGTAPNPYPEISAVPEVRAFLSGHWPFPREPFDPHTMSIGAVSVAELLEDAA